MPKTSEIPDNPTHLFYDWFQKAEQSEPSYANAMALSTVNEDGRPQVRIVLMRDLNESGVYFYTNYESNKGRALEANPFAEVNFYWKSLEKQIRIAGAVEKLSAEASDRYFNNRPRQSRIGAWASEQSRAMESPEDFEKRLHKFEKKFEGQDNPPRPSHWGGFRIIPDRYEFWEERPFRLHKRFIFTRKDGGDWDKTWLYP
ncbi:MAG: pyridoxamine 5'-phosphate oxidase, partial [Alphaproteobacteria bacterium]